MSQPVSKTLGEIAIRVSNLTVMRDFYREIIGLELMRESDAFVFFRIAEGLSGHTQVLALFDRSGDHGYVPPCGTRTTIDHIAFSVSRTDFRLEEQRLCELGIELTYAYHQWVNWRSLYVVDPEGNTVEFVCYDESPDTDTSRQ